MNLSSIKPILFLHYLLVLKTEEQDKSILCMCAYILCICMQYVIGFAAKVVLRCVGIECTVHIHCVIMCILWKMVLTVLLCLIWIFYLIQLICDDCICQFFIKIMFVFKMENVRCCIVWPADCLTNLS